MKLVGNGVLVVYGEGDQYFDDPWAALRFAAYMECMGYDCLFYRAEIVGGRVSVLGRLSDASMDDLCVMSYRADHRNRRA